jgi:hypothetical protein
VVPGAKQTFVDPGTGVKPPGRTVLIALVAMVARVSLSKKARTTTVWPGAAFTFDDHVAPPSTENTSMVEGVAPADETTPKQAHMMTAPTTTTFHVR